MNETRRYSPEVRERAARIVLEHEARLASQWATIRSIAAKIGCSRETLRRWVRRAERDAGTCYRHEALQADPSVRSARARLDRVIRRRGPVRG